MALDILFRVATEACRSSKEAALFAERAGSLDVTTKTGAHTFFELCTDWLAGRIGPVGEIELRLDGDQEALTEMLRSALEQGTIAQTALDERRRAVARLEAGLAKRQIDILKLRYRLKEVKRTNAKLSKALSRARASGLEK